MKALCWHGKKDIRYDTVTDPTIKHPRDAIIKVSSCAICGSDLHLFDGFMPTMESGDVMGHEFMGEVVEVAADNKKLKVGIGSWCHSPSHAVNATSASAAFSRCASARTAPRACSATRI